MRETIKEAIADTVQDLIFSGIKTGKTNKYIMNIKINF